MSFRLILWNDSYFIVTGIGYDLICDPPDVFYAVPLNGTLARSVLTNLHPIKIPFTEAVEITDKNEISSILILYGCEDGVP